MNIFIARAEDFKQREHEAKQASKQCKEAEAVKQYAIQITNNHPHKHTINPPN
jgi:hypothetical protein